MTVEVRFPGGGSRWLALASPVLSFVVLSCRIGYDPLAQSALSDGGAGGGSAAAASAGFAGEVAAGAASGSDAGAGGDGSSGAGIGGSSGAGIGGSSGAGIGGSSGAGIGGSAGAGVGGSSGAGGGNGCNAPANCSCQSFAAHAYWFCSTLTNRDTGQATCASGGLSLVRIDDSSEDAWIFSTALSLGTLSSTAGPSDLLFTGANDSAALDSWQWQDGTQFWSGGSSGSAVGGLYSNWASSNPQSSGTRRCAGVFYTGGWQSRSCTALQPFVCEGP